MHQNTLLQSGSSPCLVGDGPGCTSTGSEVVVSLMTVAGGGGGGGSSASSASSASVGVGGGNGYNLTPMGDSVGATFSLCRESGERIGVACRVRREWSVRKRACGRGQAQLGRATPFKSQNAQVRGRRAGHFFFDKSPPRFEIHGGWRTTPVFLKKHENLHRFFKKHENLCINQLP